MRPFYESEILFSLMFDGYEESLLSELYAFMKNLGVAFSDVISMPTYFRRGLIKAHNEAVEKESRRMREGAAAK